MRRARVIALTAGCSLALAACTTSAAEPGTDAASNAGAAGSSDAGSALAAGDLGVLAPASQDEALEALPAVSLAELPTPRLADGVTPPTNRWYSSLAFGEVGLPVFPLPMSVKATEAGFAVGLPEVTATETTIAGAHVDRVAVDLGATSYVVSAADPVSVTLDYLDGAGTVLAHVHLAAGSPYVSVTAASDLDLTLASADGTAWTEQDAGDADGTLATTTSGTGTYAVLAPQAPSADGALSLAAGASAVLWALPPDGEPADLAPYAAVVTGVDVGGSVSDSGATTTLTYRTEGNATTAVVRLPHQGGCTDGDPIGTYEGIYGAMPVCVGSAQSWQVPTVDVAAGLDVSGLTDDERAELATQVAADLDATDVAALAADTYFGGKALYRLAQLAELAQGLGDDELATRALGMLKDGMEPWTQVDGCEERSERCFGYDSTWKGVVGQATAFGSEEFNDHHFHYGYFLYAAGVLGSLDPSTVSTMQPVMDALAADIAATTGSDQVPALRVFDPYQGHSWASGISPFADGNNQESSSEAVTAWAGLELWGEASGNSALADRGAWLVANEAASALAYWVDPNTADIPGAETFSHEVVAMNWGGKRDYATWFSPEPAAMAAIQLIPLSPSAGYLGTSDPEHIRAVVAESFGGSVDLPSSPPQFSDYLLAYRGLAGADDAATALEQARTLPEDSIDDGFSRSYLLAWLMVLAEQ
ncbi:glycosyl hydrolase [Miniimonas arenae]|uniref:glycosyl hydrolase n=1 Tax=Miniimonas arenae TaxID=676201 RepID=UPI0028AA1E29|nr:glycosyl hydrolase [Miniimonas arenae]